MKTLLISGLGPSHLESEDLLKSGLNPNFDFNQQKEYFEVNKISFNPFDLIIKKENTRLLRQNNKKPHNMITPTLESILREGDINFVSLDTANIWSNSKNPINEHFESVCLSTTFMWSDYMLNYAIDWIKQKIRFEKLILGGQYSIIKADKILEQRKDIDYIITGDAEISLTELLKNLKSYSLDEMIKIPNLKFIHKGEIITTLQKCGDFTSYESPRFEEDSKVIPYMSMRGCAHKCGFCALSASNPKWRFLSADRIFDDFKKYVVENNATHFDINDSTFFIPFNKVKKLLKLLPDLNITWEANTRADTPFDNSIITELENSGCTDLFFGFESLSDTVLDYMNKRTTSAQNRKINDLFISSNINTMMSFIVGYPGEDVYEFQKTRDYLVNEHYGYFNIYSFEFEGDIMPLWRDREKFGLKIHDDSISENTWNHGGENWTHIGMNSEQAKRLRYETIRDTRLLSNSSIHKTWQYAFELPLNTSVNRHDNLVIEKLIDRLIFIREDYITEGQRFEKCKEIEKELNKQDIYFMR